MVGRVMFVVDGSVPSREAAALAHDLLPKTAEILILQVVPQLPYAWISWPAFPDMTEDLAKAWTYVSEVSDGLAAEGRNVSTRVDFSPLSAAEMDLEILRLADALQPNLICLALAKGRVTAGIVRKAPMPVLVAKRAPRDDDTTGRTEQRRKHLEPSLVHRNLLLNPTAALILRQAGIV